MNLFTKQKQTQALKTNLYLPKKKMGGRDKFRVWDQYIYVIIYKTDNKDSYSTKNSTQ